MQFVILVILVLCAIGCSEQPAAPLWSDDVPIVDDAASPVHLQVISLEEFQGDDGNDLFPALVELSGGFLANANTVKKGWLFLHGVPAKEKLKHAAESVPKNMRNSNQKRS